jgi:hypothetical protein
MDKHACTPHMPLDMNAETQHIYNDPVKVIPIK